MFCKVQQLFVKMWKHKPSFTFLGYRDISVFSSCWQSPDGLCPLAIFTYALIIKSHQRTWHWNLEHLWLSDRTLEPRSYKEAFDGKKTFTLEEFWFLSTVTVGLTVVTQKSVRSLIKIVDLKTLFFPKRTICFPVSILWFSSVKSLCSSLTLIEPWMTRGRGGPKFE